MAAASRQEPAHQDGSADAAANTGSAPPQAGIRDLISAYPWLPVVLGLLLSAVGVWCFTELTEQVYQGGPVLRVDEHLLRVSLELRSGPLVGRWRCSPGSATCWWCCR
ncbi:hypothetical protein [Saccharopolyspora gloriosae]|uniref:hypothetical protein n=1 Tax=Saccharopolyspora gloriosae TaxID=455344 RepID=UPI001FB644B3|nr:hypothetical protein [Saccharopolyspora gloriosae]